jgi:branched-chain amino acid transport system ATP-binding protein
MNATTAPAGASSAMLEVPMLEIAGLRAGHGAVTVIEGLSLAIAEREAVALLGPNGAGKSTLVMAIAGTLRNRAGTVRFAGADLIRLPPHRIVARGIAVVPEGRRIFAPLSVDDNLHLGAVRLPASRGRAAECLERVFTLFPRLAERRRQRAGTLSGGEQQMLAIGRALMSAPLLLLLDEPFLGLAPKIVDEILATLVALRSQGLTVLLVEQKTDLALDFCERAYVMQKGRIVREGACAELAADATLSADYFALPPS